MLIFVHLEPFKINTRQIKQLSDKQNLFLVSNHSILAVGIVFLIIFFLIAFIFMEHRLEHRVYDDVKVNLQQSIESTRRSLATPFLAYKQDLIFLKNSSPIQNYVSKIANTQSENLDLTSDNISTTFISMLEQHKEIDQLRIIANADGEELIRVERGQSGIINIPAAKLQNKQTREYFIHTKSMGDTQIYVSEIDLNRENGEIQYPIRPTIRLATPLIYNKEKVAILVINIDAKYLLAGVQAGVDNRYKVFLLNNQKGFLIHPEQNYAFRFEEDSSETWFKYYQELNINNNELNYAYKLGQKDAEFLYISETIDLSNTGEFFSVEGSNKKTIVVAVPMQSVKSQLYISRLNTFGLTATFAIVLILLLLCLNAYIKRNKLLNKAQTAFKAIVDGSKDAIISLDPFGNISTWNNAAEYLFNVDESSAKHRNIDDIIKLPRLLLADQIERLKSIDELEHNKIESQYSAVHLSKQLTLSIIITPMIHSASKIIGYSIVIRDISIEKTARNQVENANAMLEQQVKARTIELESARDEAQHANTLKSKFISNISHEMRTPLTGILGTLELVKKEALTNSQKDYLSMTETSVKTLNVLINDILDLSKIEAGKMSIQQNPFELIKLIESAAMPFAMQAFEKGIRFKLDLSDVKHKHLIGDETRIRQITNNLLDNAIKFTEKGEVSVRVQTHGNEDSIVMLCEIKDSGIGIDEDKQASMFGSFNQENANITNRYGGSGLGLAICKQLANLMKGDVFFRSDKNKGSTFYYVLELAENTNAKNAISLQKGLSIQLLGLEHTQNDIIRKYLSAQGGTVVCIDKLDQLSESADMLIVDEAVASNAFEYAKNKSLNIHIIDLISPNNKDRRDNDEKAHFLLKPFAISHFLHTLAKVDALFKFVSEPPNENNQSKLAEEQDLAQNKIAKRVLIVDDNDINIEVLKGMIAAHSDTMFSASNGQEALSILSRSVKANRLFDIVLLDCNMPVMDGLQCAQKIRLGEAGKANIDIPIIAITADAMLGDQEKCMQSGMNAYLTKPINSHTLLLLVKKWARKAHSLS